MSAERLLHQIEFGYGSRLVLEIEVDLDFDELDAAQVRIEGLGGMLRAANRLENGFEWRVMTDPDGNPFCIFVE